MKQGFLLVLVLVVLMASQAIAKDTLLQVYVGNKQHNMKVSLANFGYFKYGHTLTGRLQLGTVFTEWGDNVDKDRIPKNSKNANQTSVTFDFKYGDASGCNNKYQQFNEEYVSEYGAPIFLVDRGNCSFVLKAVGAQKTGKMLIVVDDSDEQDVDKIIMGDDLSGKKIEMPVVMVSKNSGTLLKEFLFAELQDLTNNEDKRVYISITFNKPQDGAQAEVQYWMIPSERTSYSFLGSHSAFLANLTLAKKVKFEPHFVFFRCDAVCKDQNKNSTQRINDFCIFDGEYCHPDPDGRGPLTGADSIKQAVTELCINSLFPPYFFLFFTKFRECYIQNNLPLKKCNEQTLIFLQQFSPDIVEANFSYKIEECVKQNTILDPVLLKKEYDLYNQQGLQFYPALFVNGGLFKGDLLLQEPSEQFICEGVEHFEDVLECTKYAKVDYDNKFTPKPEQDSNTLITVIACIVLMIFFIFGLFIYRRKMKLEMNKELAQQVDSAIQQYYALNESK